MSKKPEDAKDEEKQDVEKPDETKDESEQAEDKPAAAAEAPEETEEKAEKTAEEPEGAGDKPAKSGDKPADTPQKPLEKMTVKELREMAKDMPGMTGVHAMKKDELIVGIKKAKGIEDEPVKKADTSIAELKKKIKILKVERQSALEAKDKKRATILRRRISKLKQKTRRAAA